MNKIIYKGKELAIVRVADSYIIVPIDKVKDNDYIESLWSTGKSEIPMEKVVQFWAKIFLEK